MAPKRLKKSTKKTVEKAVKTPIMKRLTPAKVEYTPAPESDIEPVVQPVWYPPAHKTSARKYHNRSAHPEFQDINLAAGYHSALMKQLEINEELQRALIDISIAGLPDDAKAEMMKKYEGLI